MGGAGGRGEWRRAQCISTLKQTVSELYLGNGGIVVLYPIYHSSKRSHNGPVGFPNRHLQTYLLLRRSEKRSQRSESS